MRALAQHHCRQIQQRRCGGVGRHHGCQRREQQGQQEQRGHHQRGQPGAPTHQHAGGAFHISRGAGGAKQRAGQDGAAVGEQGAVELAALGCGAQQAGALRHPHQGAGGIEHLHQHEHQHHVQYRGQCAFASVALQGTGNIQFQQGGCQTRRQRDHAPVLHQPECECRSGDRQDAEQHRPAHAPQLQHADQQQPGQRQQGLGPVQVAQGDQGLRVGHHQPGFLQADHRQEQADTGGDCAA